MRSAVLVAACAVLVAACGPGAGDGPGTASPPASGFPSAASGTGPAALPTGSPGTGTSPPASGASCAEPGAVVSPEAPSVEVPELPRLRVRGMDDESAARAISRRGVPVWRCRTGIERPSAALHWVERERQSGVVEQVGWLMVLPVPDGLARDRVTTIVPGLLRGFADAGPGAAVDTTRIEGRAVYATDVATRGIDAGLAAWIEPGGVVVLFLLEPADAATVARATVGRA